jgi:hypothetical protein
MRPRLITAARGAGWISLGWRLFQSAPLAWLLLVFGYWLLMSLLSLVPLVGVLLVSLLVPGFSVGFMAAARAAAAGSRPEISVLADGFRSGARSQLVLGAVYFASVALLLAAVSLVDGGLLARWMVAGEAANAPPGELAGSALLAMGLYLPVMMMFWFAPVLTAWHDVPPAKSLFFSFFAVLLNWRAFFAYGAVVALVAFVVPFLVMLLFGMLLGNRMPVMSLALPVALMLLPTLFASFYASYREIFDSAPSDSGDAPRDSAATE